MDQLSMNQYNCGSLLHINLTGGYRADHFVSTASDVILYLLSLTTPIWEHYTRYLVEISGAVLNQSRAAY